MSELTLIGGEMPGWTDDRPGERPPAGGPVAAALLRSLAPLPPGGRVLVAGPHDDALVDLLDGAVCLVRGEADGRRLAARGSDVRCGTLAKLTDTDRYDLVVALDGLDRLCSVEGPQYDWAEALAVLRRALRPGGTLLLAVENELGVHRLVDGGVATAAHGDGGWRPLGEYDEAKPGNPTRLAQRLSADGLAVSWLGAAWPLPSTPTLLCSPNALADGPAGALSAAAAGAVGAAYAGRPVLSDPRRLAAAAVRGGLGAEFAAAWIVLAHRPPRPVLTAAPPPVLLGDGPVVELTRDGDGWRRRTVDGPPSALDGPLPTGRLLEELLLGACLRHDLPALRRLLGGWAAWLSAPDGPGAAGVDNVLLDGAAYAVLDPTRPAPPDPAAALRRFAVTLLDGGYVHPWPGATDPDTLTAVLLGAAGLDAPAGTPPPDPAAAQPPDALRELREQLRTLRTRLADAEARIHWYGTELDRRDAALRKARLQVAAFSGTLGYRVARLGYGGARKARNALRRLKPTR